MSRILIASFIAFLLTPVVALGHGLLVNWKLAGPKVEVQVFYDDNSDAAKAKVQVLNAKEEVVASGVTDDKGKWSFATPAPGMYVVHADAGAGHRAKKQLDLSGAIPVPPKEKATPESKPPAPQSSSTVSDGASREELTRTPWLKIVIGLTVIGACSGAFVIAMKVRKK
jgi:hypothetical protein